VQTERCGLMDNHWKKASLVQGKLRTLDSVKFLFRNINIAKGYFIFFVFAYI